LDTDQVLNQIVEAATKLTNAEEGMILLPDDDGALYLRAMKNVDSVNALNFRVKNDNSLVMQVYLSGEPSLINERPDQGQPALRLRTEYFVRSMVYVPMIYKGRAIGVLGVNSKTALRTFTATDQELLVDLAAHAAIAIENARLYQTRLAQNKQLTTLVEAGMAVNSTLALPDVLMSLCRQVIKVFDANGCLIQQREGDELRPLARAWQATWRAERRPKVKLSARQMLRKALDESAFYVLRRDLPGAPWKSETAIMEAVGAVSMTVITLRDEQTGRAFGALELFYQGGANAPEVTQDFRARARAAALSVCGSIPEQPDPRNTAPAFIEAARVLAVTQANWMAIWLRAGADGGDALEKLIEYGTAIYTDPDAPRPHAAPNAYETSATQERPLNHHIREENLPPLTRDLLGARGAESMLCLPLPIRGRNFGTFTIYTTLEARRYRPDEINLAWAMITQAATAIENARLYRDLAQSLTNLKQAQASLVQAARLSTIGELAAVVAHQINNPLTTVMVDSEIILEDLAADSPLREGVTAIHRAGERAHTVVKRLLTTARRGRADDQPQPIDVNQTISNTLELVLTHIERSKVRIESTLDNTIPLIVRAFPGHLEDVWLNLLLNGRDALSNTPHALIGIESRVVAGQAEVIVWDNGRGIPADVMPHIFEPFFTTKPTGEGTGLGLHIVRQVIEGCGGTIRAENSEKHGGARFIVRLPLNVHSETPLSQAEAR
jgi:signal transduction histidine kinase